MRGTIYTAPHTQRRLISGTKPDDQCVLIRIICRDLVLGTSIMSPNLGLRAGGFAIGIEPIIQSSDGKARDRQQLFLLNERESIFLADAHGRVMRIECSDGRYVIHEVSAEEIATYFKDEAVHFNTSESYDRALQRTRHLIQAGHEGVRSIRQEILALQKAA